MATKTKSTKKSTKVSTSARTGPTGDNSCMCGCGEKVKNYFAQGHDARLKGMLARGEVKNPTKAQKGFAKMHGVVIGSKKAKKAA